MARAIPIATLSVDTILQSANITQFKASQTLSQVIPHLENSHDAVFVFDDKTNKFLGVISPYYLASTRSLTTGTKLKSCVKMPPKLSPTTSLAKTAQVMMESKVYSLPVVGNDTFLGIVTINRLLNYVIENRLLNSSIIFSNERLITATPGMLVSQALAVMAKEKVAKLPVVDHHGTLVGIVSQFDLKDTVKEQIKGESSNRIGERENRLDITIQDYMKKMVITINHVPFFTEAATLMQKHKIGSLVIIDENNSPLDIVTKRDLLRTISTTLSV